MAIAITIPRLGWNMEQGVFVGWLKQDGETIRAGDPLFTLEGEKATQDIEASDPGILRIPATTPPARRHGRRRCADRIPPRPGRDPSRRRAVSEPTREWPCRARSRRRAGRTGEAAARDRSPRSWRSAAELSAGPPARARAGRQLDAAPRQRLHRPDPQGRRPRGRTGSGRSRAGPRADLDGESIPGRSSRSGRRAGRSPRGWSRAVRRRRPSRCTPRRTRRTS